VKLREKDRKIKLAAKEWKRWMEVSILPCAMREEDLVKKED
jgi:hypothetical protein